MKRNVMLLLVDGVTKTKEIDFTEPQARIVDRLLSGEKVTWINTHRRDGGDFVWDNYWGNECVGYRAFTFAIYKIADAFGLKFGEVSDMFHKK